VEIQRTLDYIGGNLDARASQLLIHISLANIGILRPIKVSLSLITGREVESISIPGHQFSVGHVSRLARESHLQVGRH